MNMYKNLVENFGCIHSRVSMRACNRLRWSLFDLQISTTKRICTQKPNRCCHEYKTVGVKNLASFSRLESLLSTVASGITGIGLWKDYGIKTPELKYFIESLGEIQLSVSALAPSPPMKHYNTAIELVYSRLLAKLPLFKEQDASENDLEEALKDAKELHGLLSAVYNDLRTCAISV